METIDIQVVNAVRTQLPTREELAGKFTHIKGWGVDIDPENDPTYPMKNPRTDAEQLGYTWQRPAQQPQTVEVLQTNERPNLPAVFGTSSPPSGLSGAIRRYAFTFSESNIMHWIPLIVADRVNMVEGLMDDLLHGTVQNFTKEKGLTAPQEPNKTDLMTNVLIGTAVTIGVMLILRGRSRATQIE